MAGPTVLINVPRGRHGGVANYYAGLRGKFAGDVRYNATGGHSGSRLLAFRMLVDYVVFAAKLIGMRPDLVHVNPSLDLASTFREGVFVLIAKVFRRRVLVFWRGWEDSVARRITARHTRLFRFVYGRADAFIVLAEDFAATLRSWGMTQEIHLETTQVDDDLLQGFRIEDKIYRGRTVLFLARIERDKGIFETIDAVQAVGREDLRLVVAGSGPALAEAEATVAERGLDNVRFLGYAFGADKAAAFRDADVFVFPTYYGEGMPNCVLEAMAFGLPVITRAVGGLKDFFEDGRMGYLVQGTDSAEIAGLLARLAADPELMRTMGAYNHRYAEQRFRASRVAARLEDIYRRTLAAARPA